MLPSIMPHLPLLASLWSLAACQGLVSGLNPIDPHARAAYFTFLDPATQKDYVFALNAVDNGDIYFHMSTRQRHDWIGVGIGNQMAGAFMLVAYAASNGTGLITSPRIASGHSEPIYTDKIEVVGVYSDAYAPNANTVTETGAMISHAMCRNCTRWMSDYLDTQSTQQPFIFALGPNKALHSDALDAGLGRHSFHGHFNMDMTAAFSSNGYGRVPAPNVGDQLSDISDSSFAPFASTQAYGTSKDIDRSPILHGVLMCIAFVGVLPLGALLLRMKNVLYHAIAQGLGLAMVIVGFGVAVSVSREYNKSKHFNSAHQLIGFLAIAALLVQLGLGLMHHTIFKRTTQPTVMGKVHLALGPTAMVLGIINGGLGLQLAGDSKTPYIVLVIVFAIIFAVARFWLYRTKGIRQYKPERVWTGNMSGVEGYQDDAESPSSFQMTASPHTPMGATSYGKDLGFGNGQGSSYLESPVSIRRADTFGSLGRVSTLETPSSYRSLKEDWSLYRQGKL